ncbi:MAG: hypothetical protein K1X63_15390 [Chitinophagales bacterium]|nr:hypothetical protein [Bacteroidota bacterium]MBX7142456.1 hypothetical protein [Chitinophagales bacterium]
MKRFLTAFLLLTPQFIFAHPGHDDDLNGGYTIHHYLTSPFHLTLGAALIVITVLIVWFVKRRNRKGKTVSENA